MPIWKALGVNSKQKKVAWVLFDVELGQYKQQLNFIVLNALNDLINP